MRTIKINDTLTITIDDNGKAVDPPVPTDVRPEMLDGPEA